jgi:hypothetical protein
MKTVAAHFQDGRVLKGTTSDFTPTQPVFHLRESTRGATGRLHEIRLDQLKGVFFLRDLEGDLGHAKSNLFEPRDQTPGFRIRIQFRDGEILNGFSQTYQPGRSVFVVVPADRISNTERAFIVTAAAADISFL